MDIHLFLFFAGKRSANTSFQWCILTFTFTFIQFVGSKFKTNAQKISYCVKLKKGYKVLIYHISDIFNEFISPQTLYLLVIFKETNRADPKNGEKKNVEQNYIESTTKQGPFFCFVSSLW